MRFLMVLALVSAQDYMDMFAPKGLENVDHSKLEAPSTDRVLKLLLYHLVQLDAGKSKDAPDPMRWAVFDKLTNMDCAGRLGELYDMTMNTQKRLEMAHSNFTDFNGLYILLHEHPDENSYYWVCVRHLRNMFDIVNTHFSEASLWTLDRKECMPHGVRVALLEMITRWRKLQGDGTALMWNAGGFGVFGDVHTTSFERTGTSRNEDMTFIYMWSGALSSTFEAHASQLEHALMTTDMGTLHKLRSYADEEYGMFEKMEIWRRDVFQQWALDKGLLRGILGHVMRQPGALETKVTLGDFGGGSGHYSKWLNETGLMQAHAYDGAKGVEEITHGAVGHINLCEPLDVGRRFDWVMCLEVAEHIPPQFSNQMLDNLIRHTKEVLVISWSEDDEGIGHINCRSLEEFYAELDRKGFVPDWPLTNKLRESCSIDYIAKSATAFRRKGHPEL